MGPLWACLSSEILPRMAGLQLHITMQSFRSLQKLRTQILFSNFKETWNESKRIRLNVKSIHPRSWAWWNNRIKRGFRSRNITFSSNEFLFEDSSRKLQHWRINEHTNLPWDVGFPAAPGFRQMLQNGPGFVLFDPFGHHIQNIVHYGRTQLQIEMWFDSLLRHSLGHTFRVTSFKLTREEIAQPALQQRSDAAQEEEPHTPSRCPDTATRTLTHRTRVEAVVDQVFQIFAHADLPHQFVLVTVHSGELADVGEDVLEPIGQLESIDIVQSILNVGVDNELCKSQNFTTQMESVTETRLLTLLRRQSLHRFQVEVVVQMEIVEILTMNQQVQHIPPLSAHLTWK